MGNKKSTCLYIDQGILETAREMGLNLSRVSENALVEAIRRLKGPETGDGLKCWTVWRAGPSSKLVFKLGNT